MAKGLFYCPKFDEKEQRKVREHMIVRVKKCFYLPLSRIGHPVTVKNIEQDRYSDLIWGKFLCIGGRFGK